MLVGHGGSDAWEKLVDDAWGRSFSFVRRSSFGKDVLDTWFRTSLDCDVWRQPEMPYGGLLPRKAAWFVRDGCCCSYEYGGTHWPPVPMPPWLLEIQAAVWEVLRRHTVESGGHLALANSCVANLYKDGSQSVDWHADNEPLFEGVQCDCCIVSLSLGSPRRFEVRRKFTRQDRHCVELGHGDLMTMEGLFQKHWQHRVAPELPQVLVGPRVNLTWRTITAHAGSCPLAKLGVAANGGC